jgi:pyruvate,orthophosphate dikinase
MARHVYFFGAGKADGSKDEKAILGGKGAGLHEMTNLGIPVPPGFTISAEVCAYYEKEGRYPEGLEKEVEAALGRLEEVAGKRFGDEQNPLLVSVRSGAAASMPGMMDTVLNLGLNERTRAALEARTKNPRFAWDAYRRFVSMFGSIVRGIPRAKFEHALDEMKRARGVKADTELGPEDLERLAGRFREIYRAETGEPFPDEPRKQLWQAIGAVFGSWQNERAKTYRRLHRIEGLLGTAVNVQAMVFGNTGERSATGVCFTRDPATGENRFFGEFLVNAQGEDVVAGIRTPQPIEAMEGILPEAYRRLLEVKDRLERHFRDLQDLEFTVEDGTLYLLQTRTGKRTGLAALRIAVDMVEEGMIDEETATLRIEPEHLEQLLFPIFDSHAKEQAVRKGAVLAKGLPAGPGAAAGKIVFFAKDAESWSKRGERVILVRHETSPEDIGGMVAAQGILTATGGMTSHAAVVGRGMGKCCVVGCGAIRLDYDRREMHIKGKVFPEGAWISIDGSTGEVIEGALETTPSEVVQVLVKKSLAPDRSPTYQRFAKALSWADRARRLKVRANADTPEDAAAAVAFGAEGIGLTRTEHMFFGEGRILAVREMIFAESRKERERALEKIEPMQRADFVGIFRAMGGRPVTIRLLDPPLHEFLPQEKDQIEEVARALGIEPQAVAARVRALHEINPMLGHRGCRLGLTYPEIYDMQVRAIFQAACAVADEGLPVRPEIMIPLVGMARELEILRERAVKIAEELLGGRRARIDYSFGTMIEIPRAAITAGEVAAHADFFSFGTNDLTQCTFGISRDDAGTFLPAYEELGIFKRDPFAALDRAGVGQLMRWAIERGRATRPGLKVGVCGEHGGEPTSIAFCHEIGLDYVSCSPYRVPIARLAAAHAALAEKGKKVASAH